MEWVTLAMLVIKAIYAVEDLYKDWKGQGTVKKEHVLAMATSAVDIAGGVSKGGQKMTADEVKENLSSFVDAGVSIMNTFTPVKVTEDCNTMGRADSGA